MSSDSSRSASSQSTSNNSSITNSNGIGNKRKNDDDSNEKEKSAKVFKPRSIYWSLLTNDENAHINKNSVCKHCNTIVKHNSIVERVEKHLRNCFSFKKYCKDCNESSLTDDKVTSNRQIMEKIICCSR